MSDTAPLVIIAGTYQQAKRWATQHNRDFLYVSEARALHHLKLGSVVYRVGTWHTRKDRAELASVCTERGLSVIDGERVREECGSA